MYNDDDLDAILIAADDLAFAVEQFIKSTETIVGTKITIALNNLRTAQVNALANMSDTLEAMAAIEAEINSENNTEKNEQNTINSLNSEEEDYKLNVAGKKNLH